MRKSLLPFIIALALSTGAAQVETTSNYFFENQVRPLLVEHCQKCHGADTSKKLKGNLSLMNRELALHGGDNGPIAVPGQIEKSLIVEAVRYRDPDMQMPPDGKLSDQQIAVIEKWVGMGLPWPEPKGVVTTVSTSKGYQFSEAQRKFWAFQPVKVAPPPAVKDTAWPRNDVDRYILAPLEAKGLKPAGPAEKRALIRRATFDLIGLPPTPEEVAAFVADGSPNAFAKVVDRLLASPAYGERWGRHWLDLVRYTDSRDARDLGQPFDITESYRYRDYVVRSFNEDKPYDQFIKEQIAGDLIPSKDPKKVNADGIIATGMLCIGSWGGGDADAKKMHTDMVDDQVNTVSRVFMGLTVGCARCHDHKFDPIPQADYYGLAGIFFSTTIAPPQISPPWVHVPLATKEQIEKSNKYAANVAAAEKGISTFSNAAFAALPKHYAAETGKYLLAAYDYENRAPQLAGLAPTQFAPRENVRPEALAQWIEYLRVAPNDSLPLDRITKEEGGRKGVIAWRTGSGNEPVAILNTTDEAMAIPGALPAKSLALHPGPQDGIGLSWQSPVDGVIEISGTVAHAHPACGDGVAWVIEKCSPQPIRLADGDLPLGARTTLTDAKLKSVRIKRGESIRLVILPKANHSCDLTDVDITIREKTSGKSWNAAKEMIAGPFTQTRWQLADVKSGGGIRHAEQGPQSALAQWFETAQKVAAGKATRDELEGAAKAVQLAIDTMASRPADEETPAGRLYQDVISQEGPFRSTNRDESLLPSREVAKLRNMRGELETLKKDAPPPIEIAMGAQDGGAPNTKYAGFHDCQIHIRGSYEHLGAVVPRHFPRIIAGDNQPGITQGSGRLQLAEWLASPKHPLTARVMVNRIWQHHFGTGIVRTPGNFGKLGEAPTNPQLLDYLADQFVKFGWSIKAMHRRIMLSATYQQSSHADEATLAADPENKLFGRMNVRRLEAEAIRDTLLDVAGKLDRSMGGKPVRDLNSDRRTIYCMTVRSDKSGFWFLFDKADPEAVVDTRTNSTVAPQALFMLNGDFMAPQVSGLVDRLTKAAKDDRSRIDKAYRLLYGRPPETQETAAGEEYLNTFRKESGERQAWEEYAQVLLCANELIYVE